MNIQVNRIFKGDTYTIGHLFVNDKYVCDTLEDEVRPGKKVFAETAIPAGTYTVTWSFSPHFCRNMPEVLNVPGFRNIRIHAGNDSSDTEGCILLGQNKVKGRIINSRECCVTVYDLIFKAFKNKEKIILQIG
jgi:hypothetical protein